VEAVEVNRSLVDVADGFRPVAPLHTILVEGDLDAAVVADRKALGQVLDQLVDNAIKYSPSGGLVTLAAHRRGSRVEITVEDEGVGLPSDAARIFEAFAQGEDLDRRTHDEGGVGVGLFIARPLLAGRGGTVRAERRHPEPGTRLVVTLKRAPASPAGDGQLVRPGRVHGPS
jgi:signal transduction histidine kinase